MRNPQQKIKRRPFASWRPQKKPHRLPNRKPIARILRQKMPGLTIWSRWSWRKAGSTPCPKSSLKWWSQQRR